MRGFVRLAVLLPLLLALMPGCRSKSQGKDADVAIDSAVVDGDTVLASTAAGLFRASAKDKIWHRMEAAKALPPGGIFIRRGDSGFLDYYKPWSAVAGGGGDAALFASRDMGATWKQLPLPSGHRFTEFYTDAGGTFYACEPALAAGTNQGRVCVSNDGGSAWTDITANLPAGCDFYGFFRAGDNQGPLCVQGRVNVTMQPVAFQLEADGQWKERKIGDLPHLPEGEDFGGFTGSRNCPYSFYIPATLANFFALPFLKSGNDLRVYAAQIVTTQSSYTFRKDGPKVIPVKVALLWNHPQGRFYDTKDETVFWGWAPVVPPLAKGFEPRVMALGTPPGQPGAQTASPPDHDKKAAAYLADPDLKSIDLDPEHPYGRDIDLAKMGDWSKPGSYKLQLYHEDATLERWGCAFGSQVIEVTITE
jgi:hypothetical protein